MMGVFAVDGGCWILLVLTHCFGSLLTSVPYAITKPRACSVSFPCSPRTSNHTYHLPSSYYHHVVGPLSHSTNFILNRFYST